MKLVCYIQCALGDFYEMLSVLPRLIADRGIAKEDVKFYVDSVYFVTDQYPREREAAIKMMETVTKNWEIVPEELGSFMGLVFTSPEQQRPIGPVYDDIKHDFLFYRHDATKKYIKSKIDKDTIFLSSIVAGCHLYEWVDGTNVKLDYEPKPLEFQLSVPEMARLEAKFDESVLVHVRTKGHLKMDYFNSVIEYCEGLTGCHVVPVGTNKICEELSFEEIMYAIGIAPLMITGSSMFTYHRFHYNKPTIVVTSHFLGLPEKIYPKSALENPNHVFVNADTPCLDIVLGEVDKWNSK